MISGCLQKEKVYVILRPFNLADEGIIRYGIWKQVRKMQIWKKTYNCSTVSIINHQTLYQGKSYICNGLQISNWECMSILKLLSRSVSGYWDFMNMGLHERCLLQFMEMGIVHHFNRGCCISKEMNLWVKMHFAFVVV